MESGIGWFGISGGPSFCRTKTHWVVNRRPRCGARLRGGMLFQWCAPSDLEVPECKTCAKMLRQPRPTPEKERG